MLSLVNKLLIKGIDVSSYHFTHNGHPVDKQSNVSIETSDFEQKSGVVVIRAYPGAQGGKGGFGALIRAMGMQINKSRSRDACRDLSGRRMRDVNAEKKLAEWAKDQPEKECKKAAEKARKREMLLSGGPKHFFDDSEYMQQLQATGDNMDLALRQGLQVANSNSRGKRKSDTVMDPLPSKKSKTWFGLDDDLDTDSDDQSIEDDQLGGKGTCPSSSTSANPERDPKLPYCQDSHATSVHSDDQELQTIDQQQSCTKSQPVKHPADSGNSNRDPQAEFQNMPKADSQTSDQDHETNLENVSQSCSQTSDHNLKAISSDCKQGEHQIDPQSKKHQPQAFSTHDSNEIPGLISSGTYRDENECPPDKDDGMELPQDTDEQMPGMAQEEKEKLPTSSEADGQQHGVDPNNITAVTQEMQPLDLDQFSSAKELEEQGANVLKLTLQQLGLKCGGTVTERAQRLFSVKGKNKDEIDRSLFAKHGRGRGKGKKAVQTSHQ